MNCQHNSLTGCTDCNARKAEARVAELEKTLKDVLAVGIANVGSHGAVALGIFYAAWETVGGFRASTAKPVDSVSTNEIRTCPRKYQVPPMRALWPCERQEAHAGDCGALGHDEQPQPSEPERCLAHHDVSSTVTKLPRCALGSGHRGVLHMRADGTEFGAGETMWAVPEETPRASEAPTRRHSFDGPSGYCSGCGCSPEDEGVIMSGCPIDEPLPKWSRTGQAGPEPTGTLAHDPSWTPVASVHVVGDALVELRGRSGVMYAIEHPINGERREALVKLDGETACRWMYTSQLIVRPLRREDDSLPLSPPIEVVRSLVGWLKNMRPCPECEWGTRPETHPSYPMTHEEDCDVGQTLARARAWLDRPCTDYTRPNAKSTDRDLAVGMLRTLVGEPQASNETNILYVMVSLAAARADERGRCAETARLPAASDTERARAWLRGMDNPPTQESYEVIRLCELIRDVRRESHADYVAAIQCGHAEELQSIVGWLLTYAEQKGATSTDPHPLWKDAHLDENEAAALADVLAKRPWVTPTGSVE
jgi:hypothetical protein